MSDATCRRCGTQRKRYGPYLKKQAGAMYEYHVWHCATCSARTSAKARGRMTPLVRRIRNPEPYSDLQKRVRTAAIEALVGPEPWSCQVCGVPLDLHTAHIDHDHSCPCGNHLARKGRAIGCEQCRRGLLCQLCNLGLGSLGDGRNPELIASLADYAAGLPYAGPPLRNRTPRTSASAAYEQGRPADAEEEEEPGLW